MSIIDKIQQHSINERINRLEEKVFKNKKKPTTLNQQILLLYHLGMLDNLLSLDITNVKKAELLSLVLNGDASNTKKALEALSKKDDTLRNTFNYEFLLQTFENMELNVLTDKMRKILSEIEADSERL